MQSSTINALLGIGSAVPSAGGPTAATILGEDGSGPSTGQAFAQLLNDSGAQAGGDGLPQFTGGALLQTSVASALSAQEVGALDLTDHVGNALTDVTQELITPQQASQIVARIDQTISRGDLGTEAVAMLNKLKEQVQRIATGGEPKTVAQVLQTLPPIGEASTPSLKGLVMALFASRKAQSQRTTNDEEVPTQMAAMWQNVQASMFRTDRREATAAAPATLEETQKKPEEIGLAVEPANADAAKITVIEPLAASILVAMPVSAVPIQETLSQSISDLDAVIPPLTSGLSEDAAAAALPEIELPKLAVQSAPHSGSEMAAKLVPAALEGDAANKPSFAKDLAEATSDAAPATTDMIATAPTLGHTQTAHAARSVNLTPTPGHINQAPVTEQVHVAIQQASKEGVDRITIQLDPIDLGRVEVSMQTHRDGQTHIQFLVDKPETFDSLSRDARFLERTLQEAGIKADTGSMQFNLRQPPQQNVQADVNGQGQPQQQNQTEKQDEQHVSSAVAVPAALIANHYILNVREGVDISA